MDKISKLCITEHRKGRKDQEATNLHEPLNINEDCETLSFPMVLN